MCHLELISEPRLSTDMQVATASVSIAPFPALENDVKNAFDELTVRLEEVGEVAKAIGKLADMHVPCKVEEVADDQVTPVNSKLCRQKAFFMSPPALPTKKAFVDLTKELPQCCPMMCPMMPSGKVPAHHLMFVTFLAGALVGSALVMCFSDHGLVE